MYSFVPLHKLQMFFEELQCFVDRLQDIPVIIINIKHQHSKLYSHKGLFRHSEDHLLNLFFFSLRLIANGTNHKCLDYYYNTLQGKRSYKFNIVTPRNRHALNSLTPEFFTQKMWNPWSQGEGDTYRQLNLIFWFRKVLLIMLWAVYGTLRY